MDFWKEVIHLIAAGGEAAIIVLLLLIIAGLIFERKSLIRSISELSAKVSESHNRVIDAKESEVQSIKDIVDQYHNGTLTTIQALNEIKIVLTSIRESLR